MRSWRIVCGLAIFVASTPGGLAAKLDRSACNLLNAELAGIVASGTRDDMERGPQWAVANLPPLKLRNIRRLIELEEQLEFRCGMKHDRVVDIEAEPPSNAKGDVIVPVGPERKPELKTDAKKPREKAESAKPAAAPKAAAMAAPKKADKAAPKTAVAAPPKPSSTPPASKPVGAATVQPAAAPDPAKSTRRRSSAGYVSPTEVNPFFVTRYGDTQ